MQIIAPGLAALFIGTVLVVLGLVPWAAHRYRRRGELGAGAVILAFATVVYAVALLTYTLLPLPQSTEVAALCLTPPSPQLRPLQFLRDITTEGGLRGPRSLLANRAAAQVIFNVALFVPLGVFVRNAASSRAGGRASLPAVVMTGTIVGAAASLLIELTQLTGDWFLYPCAYRIFDVDDLLANTAGSLLGTLAASVALRRGRPRAAAGPDEARPVTVRRRWFGMACDLVAALLALGGLAAATTVASAVAEVAPGTGVPEAPLPFLLLLVPAAQLVVVLATGRTLGEAVVRLRPTPRPSAAQRVVRWAAGSGGWSLALVLSTSSLLAGTVAAGLAIGAVVGVLATPDRRGLANVLARLGVADERVTTSRPQP
jgi:glycopeptide antibiotics resistance protein